MLLLLDMLYQISTGEDKKRWTNAWYQQIQRDESVTKEKNLHYPHIQFDTEWITSLITTLDTDESTQCSVYQTQVLTPLKSQACIVYWDAGRYRWRKTGHSPETEAARQSPLTQTQTATQLGHWQTGAGRLSSSPFHSTGVPSSTAREYPFPSGRPRGKEAGNVAVFGAPLWMCVWVSAY